MKQTNNAIKFLMAQYRAIFKNANIAMVAAMVAAALAAGQANAKAGDRFEPTASFADELKDGKVSTGENLVHNSADTFITLNAPEGAIVIDGGKIQKTAAATGHIFTKHDIVLKNGSLDIAAGTAKGEIVGLVGAEKDIKDQGEATPVASLNVQGGEVKLTNSFITMKNVTFNGGAVTAGGPTNKDNAAPFLNYANIYALGGEMSVGGTAVVNLNPASGLKGNNVTITGGTINFNGTTEAGSDTAKNSGAYVRAGDSVMDGVLTVAGGKLVVAQGKYGNATGTNIKITGGEVDVKGTFTLGKDFKGTNESTISVTGGKVSVANGGTLGLDGNASFADGTLTNAGTVNVVIPQDGTRTLTVASKGFTELLKGKLTANGVASSGTETLELVVDGDADLVTSGFLTADGAINTTHAEFTDVDASSLTAKNVTIGAASYSGATAIKADSLVAGKEGAFAIKSGSTVDVAKGLTVTAKDAKADLTVNGTLNLDGIGSVIGANKVILASDSSSTPALNIKNGTWSVKDLTLTSGTATVTGEGTALDITGTLATKNANGILSIEKSALVDASEGVLTLEEATVKLTGGSTLVLDGNDVFKKNPDGSFAVVTAGGDIKSTFAQGAVTTDSTSVLSLKFTGDLSVADLDSIKTAIDKTSGLKGFIKFEGATITDKPKDDVAINAIKPGFDGIYNDVAVTVGTGGAVNQTFTAGQIKLTDTDTTAAVDAGKTVMLTGSKGDFVVKKDGSEADVSLASGAGLVLAGNGDVGAITASAQTAGHKATIAIGHSSLGYGTVNAKSIDGATAGLDVAVYGSTLNVAGKVAASDLTIEDGSALNIKAAAGQGAISATTLTVGQDSSISAAGQAIAVGGSTNGATEILGDVTAKSLTYAGTGDHIIAGDAVVNLDTLDFGTSTVQIGDDAAEANGSATVVVKNLSGTGTLFVDPKYGDDAALVIAESLDAPAKPESNEAGTFNGKAIVGNNAALGIGFASEAELNAVLGQFLDADGSFTENPAADKLELANAIVLNKKINVGSGDGILVKKNAKKGDTVTGDSVTLEAGTGLIVTDNVYSVPVSYTHLTLPTNSLV